MSKITQINQNTEILVEGAINIARDAGARITEIYKKLEGNNAILIKSKSDNSPLTIADLASHRTIINGLNALDPSIPIVSEEDALSFEVGPLNQIFWLIDPLDGTKEFMQGNGQFTVNIALIENGYPKFGVVACPAMNKTYWGGKGIGAFREHLGETKKISVISPLTTHDKYRAVVSRSHLNEQTIQYLKKIGEYDCVQAGSSLKFCLVAEGEADIYPRLGPTCEWDTAAAQAVLEGALGYVLDLNGERLKYGKKEVLNPDFIASSFVIEF